MGMPAAQCDYVIGVDTHRDTHTLAICDHLGAQLYEGRIRAEGSGYRDALALAAERAAIPRSGQERQALQILMATRHGAVHARTQALNQLAALILTAFEPLRARLRGLSSGARLRACARLRRDPRQAPAWAASLTGLRASARRAIALGNEADELAREIERLVQSLAPELLAQPGVGPICAAQILISWSHPGRLHCEAAFAALGGVAPIPASSGQTVRHRLNRGGDRQLNRALHTIARCRMAHDPATKDYVARRRAQGKSVREARRCLVRFIARALYRLLEGPRGPRLTP